jgi:hypothetical protein
MVRLGPYYATLATWWTRLVSPYTADKDENDRHVG